MRASNSPWSVPAWAFAVAAGIALILAFALYGPALDGPFLFDDLGLPFYSPSFAQQPLFGWISGVRPLLMFSYWLNFQLSERDPWSYHAGNVLLHTGLVDSRIYPSVCEFFGFARSILVKPYSRLLSRVFCSLPPAAKEAVGYIAGRSELLAAFFVLAALAVYANPNLTYISWRTALIVLALYFAQSFRRSKPRCCR